MLIPFDRYDWLMMKDLERCPYVMWSKEAAEWDNDFQHRMTLTALERYSRFLLGESREEDIPRGFRIVEKYPNWDDKTADLGHLKSDIRKTFYGE